MISYWDISKNQPFINNFLALLVYMTGDEYI